MASANAGYADMYVTRVLPLVRDRIEAWHRRAGEIEDPDWRCLAQQCIDRKRFHTEGGSIFAILLLARGLPVEELLDRIAALQLGVDFLDDFSDRTAINDRVLVFQLHRFLCGGPHPPVPPPSLTPVLNYLADMRRVVWQGIDKLPSYRVTRLWIRQTLVAYARMQAISQCSPGRREVEAQRWALRHQAGSLGLTWQEHHAAHGSTVPALLGLAASYLPGIRPREIDQLHSAYHPWFVTLHILLDSLVDRDEDRMHGDLNLTEHLETPEDVRSRFRWLIQEWQARSSVLENRPFHHFVLHCLIKLYLGTHDPELAERLLADPANGAP